jgi:tetratricopeptide (TPR) repeat protein
VVPAADAGGEAAMPDAGEAEAEEVEEVEDGSAEAEVKKPSPKVKKAQVFAAKLLMKRRFNKALKFLEGWIQKEPSDPAFRVLYGRAKAAKRWYKSAAEELEKAAELDPGLAEAYYQLGGVYIRMKDNPKACQALKKYVELAPRDRRTPAVRKNIRKLNCPE